MNVLRTRHEFESLVSLEFAFPARVLILILNLDSFRRLPIRRQQGEPL
jgi:hypothetical protein